MNKFVNPCASLQTPLYLSTPKNGRFLLNFSAQSVDKRHASFFPVNRCGLVRHLMGVLLDEQIRVVCARVAAADDSDEDELEQLLVGVRMLCGQYIRERSIYPAQSNPFSSKLTLRRGTHADTRERRRMKQSPRQPSNCD